jgi:2-C-methyl-D-erythritol 2,4-cyclodiphosphate synthase
MTLRVGLGYDIHRLVEGLPLRLGGVDIEHDSGLEGHSDADVLVHSIIDALLGACGEGDIGLHFPSSDDNYKGIDSLVLLDKTMEILWRKQFIVKNIDSVIVCQEPFLAPYISEMRMKLSEILGISVDEVSVKATTNEGVGPEGTKEAISARAVALISRDKDS